MQNVLKKVIYSGLFIVPFIPLFMSSSFFFPFITTKAFAWRIIVEVIFASWLVLIVLDKDYRPRRSSVLYAVLGFLAIIGLANLFGANLEKSLWSNFERMEGYIALLHLGAFFLVIGSLFREVDWKRWWNTSLVASAVMVLYSSLQLLGSIPISQGGVRVDGTFGNATYLAVYMLIHIFIALWLVSTNWRKKGLRWAYLLLILTQLVVLYHTATRGAILGLLGGLVVISLLNLRNRENRMVRKVSLASLIGIVLIAGGFFFLRDTSFVQDSPVLVRFAEISTNELQGGGRSFVWPMAIEGFKERPILGWGQENFQYVFQENYDPEMFALEPWFDRAHNIFLDWMVAGGALGILSYLSLYVAILFNLWRRDQEMSYTEKTIITGLLAAYFFHNLFVFDHLLSYILFFSLLAYIYSRTSGEVIFSKNYSQLLATRFAAPVIAVALVTTVYFVNVSPMRANTYIIEALSSLRAGETVQSAEAFQRAYEQSRLGREEVMVQVAQYAQNILSANSPVEERNTFYAFAQNAVKQTADSSPQDAKLQLAAGSFLAETGNLEEALSYLEHARNLIPGKQQVYFEIGSAQILSGEPQSALASFKAAYEMAPEYKEAKIIYLIGAIYARDRELEASLIGELEERDIIFDNRIISSYVNNNRRQEAINLLERRKQLDPDNIETYDRRIQEIRSSN